MARELEDNLKTEAATTLCNALSELKTAEEVAAFLRDVLTLEEMDEMIRRFQVAKMLKEGMTVRRIAAETNMSSTTISRINYWLHHGTGGYGLALERLIKT